MHLTHLPDLPAAQFPGYTRSTQSSCAVYLLWGADLSGCDLLLDVNSLGLREDIVSNWQLAHSLVGDSVSGAGNCSSPLCLSSGCGTPASLPPGRRALNGSQLALLWNSLGHNPLFSECAEVIMQLWKLSRERVPFFLDSLSISQFGLLCHIRSFRLSSRAF